jgi:poly-gamma-glutamate capsule biosynthesis protein CapA/YwtB (metallophosphatase superfamily)
VTAGLVAGSLLCPTAQAEAEHQSAVRFTVAATGDVLTHPRVLESARLPGSPERYDFEPLLRRLEPRIRAAHLALCHQEFVLGPGPPQPFPRYRAPPSLARATGALGWDACSVASNHSVDEGREGIASTIAALRAAGLRHTGTYVSRAASKRTLMLHVRGVRIALLSYTDTTNGVAIPRPFHVNVSEPHAILADARRARRRGADAVIVNLHTTGNFDPVTPEQRSLARRLAASPAVTAIIGQGPHAVRPIRFSRGKPVIFSEGDLVEGFDSQPDPEPASGLIAELHFVARPDRVRVASIRYLPLYVRERDRAAVVVGRALRRHQAGKRALRSAYREVVRLAGRSPRVKPIPRRLPRG